MQKLGRLKERRLILTYCPRFRWNKETSFGPNRLMKKMLNVGNTAREWLKLYWNSEDWWNEGEIRFSVIELSS